MCIFRNSHFLFPNRPICMRHIFHHFVYFNNTLWIFLNGTLKLLYCVFLSFPYFSLMFCNFHISCFLHNLCIFVYTWLRLFFLFYNILQKQIKRTVCNHYYCVFCVVQSWMSFLFMKYNNLSWNIFIHIFFVFLMIKLTFNV